MANINPTTVLNFKQNINTVSVMTFLTLLASCISFRCEMRPVAKFPSACRLSVPEPTCNTLRAAQRWKAGIQVIASKTCTKQDAHRRCADELVQSTAHSNVRVLGCQENRGLTGYKVGQDEGCRSAAASIAVHQGSTSLACLPNTAQTWDVCR